ncbi:FCD domain-containing protein [Paraburkholderia oxyphila]|uniref:FCD domain-containing protein n=1 Tax=Paraburkholderia oxyphila TaxID=614212 RepID=UPI00047FE81A
MGHAPCKHDEHRAILDCLESGDADGAVAHMSAHLRELEARIETTRMPGARGLAHLLGMDPSLPGAVE